VLQNRYWAASFSRSENRGCLLNSEIDSHSDQICQGLCMHLAHDLSAMNTDSKFASAEFSGSLFARHASNDKCRTSRSG